MRLFNKIQNAQLVKKAFIFENQKKMNENFLNLLWDAGFILGYRTNKNLKKSRIFLKYHKTQPSIQLIKKMNRLGFKSYYSFQQIWKLDATKTFMILVTDHGFKTITQCKKLKIGGKAWAIIN